MTLTTTYAMTLDDDGHAPLELTWEIEYVPTDDGIEIVSKTVTALWMWIGKTAHRVEKWRHEWVGEELITLDAYRDAEIAYTHLLDEEAVLEKCLDHWDTDGMRKWLEQGRWAA